jgi:hypothetical protein
MRFQRCGIFFCLALDRCGEWMDRSRWWVWVRVRVMISQRSGDWTGPPRLGAQHIDVEVWIRNRNRNAEDLGSCGRISEI